MENKIIELKQKIAFATGNRKVDLLLKNAKIVNVFTEEIIQGDIAISGDTIIGIGNYKAKKEIDCQGQIIAPGFIDAHMHIESGMVMPLELAKAVLKSGTTTLIADPHELVNIGGAKGLDFILEATENIPLNIYIMLPSSVPATHFETNGSGDFTAEDMIPYINHPRVLGLGEVMCYPDVVAGANHILEKISLCENKHCDGHAPGLTGKPLQAYILAGVENDHECTHFDEVLEKVRAGMKILVREGSGEKNLDDIISGAVEKKIPLTNFLFCTDDKHLEDIENQGHIRWNIKKAIACGVPPITAIRMASIQAAQAYGLNQLGAIAPGYKADLVVIDTLEDFNVVEVYKDGLPYKKSLGNVPPTTYNYPTLLNSVHVRAFEKEDLQLKVSPINDVIGIVPWQITTTHLKEPLPKEDVFFQPNNTYSKFCVFERYGKNGSFGIAAVKGFGITKGAIGTTVGHDSHNLMVIGDNDDDILIAVEHLKKIHGGYVIVSEGKILGDVPLGLGGIMSLEPGDLVQTKVKKLIEFSRELGVPKWVDPFMNLSFLALPVLPEIRLTDRGLFDSINFKFLD
ncbi:MAG: adenine deaminase [Eubacteriaceae bacterium]